MNRQHKNNDMKIKDWVNVCRTSTGVNLHGLNCKCSTTDPKGKGKLKEGAFQANINHEGGGEYFSGGRERTNEAIERKIHQVNKVSNAKEAAEETEATQILREPNNQKNNNISKNNIKSEESNKDGMEKKKNKRKVWKADLHNKFLEAMNMIEESKSLWKFT